MHGTQSCEALSHAIVQYPYEVGHQADRLISGCHHSPVSQQPKLTDISNYANEDIRLVNPANCSRQRWKGIAFQDGVRFEARSFHSNAAVESVNFKTEDSGHADYPAKGGKPALQIRAFLAE